MSEKPELKVVADEQPVQTPSDARDIESLWDDPRLGDGLTDINLHSVPVDKPKDFFRVHPGPSYRRRAEVYVHKVEGEIDTSYYVLGPKMKGRLEEARPCILVTCIYRDGSPRIWPIMLPRDGEKDNAAWSSARKAARTAMDKWVKLVWVKRAYLTRDAQPGYSPEPDWTKLPPFNDLAAAGLGSHGIMEDTNHPIYRALLGAPKIDNDNDDGL
jgi:hypothetical protein